MRNGGGRLQMKRSKKILEVVVSTEEDKSWLDMNEAVYLAVTIISSTNDEQLSSGT